MITLYKKNPKSNIKQFIKIVCTNNEYTSQIIYKTIEEISFKGGYYLDIYNRPPYIICNDRELINSLGYTKKCKAVVTIDGTHPQVQECINEKISEYYKNNIK